MAIIDTYRNNISRKRGELSKLSSDKAKESNTGARGLKSIIEDSMNDLMFDLPSEENVKSVKVVIENDNIAFEKRVANVA